MSSSRLSSAASQSSSVSSPCESPSRRRHRRRHVVGIAPSSWSASRRRHRRLHSFCRDIETSNGATGWGLVFDAIAPLLGALSSAFWTRPIIFDHPPLRRPQEGCCGGRDVEIATRNMVEIAYAAYFEHIGTDLPACNRWYTFPVHLCRQAGSFFCHGLLKRVSEKVFIPSSLRGPNDDQDSYHVHCHKKMTAAREFIAGPKCGETLGFALVATMPIDHLSLRLQHLDAHGAGSIRELTDMCESGLIKSCMAKYYDILNFTVPSLLSGASSSLWWHLQSVDLHEGTFCDMLRQFCVGLSAVVWSRLEIKRLWVLNRPRARPGRTGGRGKACGRADQGGRTTGGGGAGRRR